ncbi:Peptidyl-prolyl cis-trans isomerase FKBP13, chloroplastic [Sesamum alatum]|uniref:peptidylprolyl isomerase n=1 Tax=Sesamum alatum TaxID=300844 RepID=A0AAE1YU02_9LAMI|nr:Peptidyl-prolyl cis-trans isomerase FKBP13, chloroplastic [Sesamum alatum]
MSPPSSCQIFIGYPHLVYVHTVAVSSILAYVLSLFQVVAAGKLEFEMNALPFSIPTYHPTARFGSFTTKNLHTVESAAVNFNETKYSKTIRPASLSRREAVGIGVCFGFLQLLNPAAAESAAAPPCEYTAAPSGLAYCDNVIGSGPEAVKGQLIKAHYVGRLENGTVFDSSYNRGKPLAFRIGVGEVIKGWDEGILGGEGIPAMLAGGKRKLRIPPELGYGVRGAGCRGGSCVIPPNSVLLFDVEFIGKA